jgi:rhamnulokinase
VKILHVIGGGSQNELLNQFTANILDIPIEVGPVEATAIGNLLMQAYAKKEIQTLKQLRKIVRNSFPIKRYEPKNILDWQQAYKSYLKIISN